MAESLRTVRKTGVQIRLGRGEPFGVFRVDGEHDPLMNHLVHLGNFVTFVLIDDEYIAGVHGVKFVVDQKLSAAGDGIIDFVAIMDMHVHGFFFFIKVGNGEGFRSGAVLHGLLTGIEFFHMTVSLSFLSILSIIFRKVFGKNILIF